MFPPAKKKKAPDHSGALSSELMSISSEALRHFECGCEFSPNALKHRNNRNSNASCNQSVFDGGRPFFVLCKADDGVSHIQIVSVHYGGDVSVEDRNKAPLRGP